MEIIAEAAIGHEGVPDRAFLLIRAAAAARPDAVKFQMVMADELATPDYIHYETFRKSELPFPVWERMVLEARAAGLRFYADVFGANSLEMARRVGVDGVKIHASNITCLSLIRAASKAFDRIYLACGGAEAGEIEAATAICRETGRPPVLLVGFQAEPTPVEENHLRRIRTLQSRFPHCVVGFMDHTEGTHALKGRLALVALGLGAGCVEKHITLDRVLRLEDHISALDPAEFKEFCLEIRSAQPALGEGDLSLRPAERRYAASCRKRIVATTDLPAGTRLADAHLDAKRLPGMDERTDLFDRVEAVLGRVLRRPLTLNRPVTADDLEPPAGGEP